jgi:hypothetical protein
MILKGSQRGGAKQLANHLLNPKDNDHVTIEEMRGFVADDLDGAFAEAHAVSKATRCQQFLFSLSLNPPKGIEAGLDVLVGAADRAEAVLGLKDQPRAIIIHEKEGRRHAHVVWSRIDAEEMKAIHLPFFKTRLCELSRELYLEHGWELPEGHKTNGWKNPLNFTLAEWQQAKRVDLDPREIKQVFRAAWEQSDNLASFRNALEEHGYFLAQGDRRGFVAVDTRGEAFAVARWAGVKTSEVRDRLGSPQNLPSVDDVRKNTRGRMSQKLRSFIREDKQSQASELKPLMREREAMVAFHRAERDHLLEKQDKRWRKETKERSDRLHKGLRGVLEILTGRARTVRRENEREAYKGHLRDRDQREALFKAQMKERGGLQERLDTVRRIHRQERMRLARRIAEVLRFTSDAAQGRDKPRQRKQSLDFDMEL